MGTASNRCAQIRLINDNVSQRLLGVEINSWQYQQILTKKKTNNSSDLALLLTITA